MDYVDYDIDWELRNRFRNKEYSTAATKPKFWYGRRIVEVWHKKDFRACEPQDNIAIVTVYDNTSMFVQNQEKIKYTSLFSGLKKPRTVTLLYR